MTIPSEHTFESQRLRLAYLDWGNHTAPPLILVHGGRDHAWAWDDVARALAIKRHVIAPDLRGHGDSQWADCGGYTMPCFMYDLTELIRHLRLEQVTLVGHSLGGNIATRVAGLYPNLIRQLVSIEGLGPSPARAQEMAAKPVESRLRGWIDEQRQLAVREHRVYPKMEDATARMQEQNPHLSPAQALYLTTHGVRHTEGGFAWKFDPYLRSWPPIDLTREEIRSLWTNITCPVKLIYGAASWASNPAQDGRAAQFRNATVSVIEGAGHWAHHDRFENFMNVLSVFLT